jgi:sec-independent protein translocase protein TatB
MNFFGVGPAELVVILVVALVFVGPERLPRLAADLARTIREIRKYTSSLAAEFNEVIQDFEKETVGDRSQWSEIGEGLTGATRSVTEALRGARADAAGATLAAELAAAKNPAAAADDAPTVEEADWREIPEPPSEPDAPAAADAAPAEIAQLADGQAPVQAAEEPR